MKKTKGLIALTIAAVLISNVCYAEPIYLDCKSDGGNFSVKMDETNGKITHTPEDGDGAGILAFGGALFNTEGFFSANEIGYQKITSLGIVTLTRAYKINRSDLSLRITSIQRTPAPASEIPFTTNEYKGSCKTVSIKNRKI